MDDKVTLLPCPFCGGKASASGKTHFTLKEPDAWWNDGTPIIDAFFCNCTRCGITNQTIVGGYQTQAMAIAEWNRRQAQEAPKTDDLQEVIDDYRRLTRELDVALNGDGAAKQASLCDIVAQVKRERETPKVASQSAEELAYKLADHGTIHCGHEDCKACPEHLKNWIKDIEADRAAQRQAGREEIQAESILHFNNRAAHLSERYADLVEALEEILPINDGDIGKGLAPYYIHSDTIKRARKALSALGEGREG